MLRKMMFVLVMIFIFALMLNCEDSSNSGAQDRDFSQGNNNSDNNNDDETINDEQEDEGSSDVDSDSDGDADTSCDAQDFNIEPAPVQLMILQDMSSSMAPQYGNRWNQARKALTTLLTNWKGKGIQFGFDMFPNGAGMFDTCGVNKHVVMDCALNKEQDIIDELQTLSPSGGTPFYLGMKKFTEPAYSPRCTDTEAGSAYLLVVSDGGDGCGVSASGGSNAGPVQFGNLAKELLDLGIKTFAIGFGNGYSSEELKRIVQNGGTGRTTFLRAANEAKLQEAFEDIASSVVSCVYELDEVGSDADPTKVNFYFDGDPVGYDDGCDKNEGWTWVNDSMKKVEFCEAACQDLQLGEVDKISAEFGCIQFVVQ